MEQQKRNGDRTFKVITVIALVVAVLCLSVAYATLSQQLTIEGTAEVEAAEWKVDNNDQPPTVEKEGEGDVDGDPTAKTEGGVTTVTFKAKLRKPGDAVEISVPVKNTGDIDAELASVTGVDGVLTCTSGETPDKTLICGNEQSNNDGANVKYTVYYNDTEVTSLSSISNKDLPKQTGSATVKVRVEYLSSAVALPTAPVEVKVPDVTFVYQQKMS